MGYYERNHWKQKSHQCPSSQFYHGEKQRNVKTSFQNYINYNGPCLSNINIPDLELKNAFASLKTNKSSGYDDISADVVKRVSDEIFVILKYIFNISLAKAVFPEKLKIAWVTPIFKKGNNTLVTNYRPFQSFPVSQNYLDT